MKSATDLLSNEEIVRRAMESFDNLTPEHRDERRERSRASNVSHEFSETTAARLLVGLKDADAPKPG